MTYAETLMARTDLALLVCLLAGVSARTFWTRSSPFERWRRLPTSAGWLDAALHLYLHQIAGRAVAVLVLSQRLRRRAPAFGLDANTYPTVAHALPLTRLLVLWLALRADRTRTGCSRGSHLAMVNVLVHFLSHLIVGIGLWLIWLVPAS